MTLEAKISEKIQLRRERIDCLKREHGDFVISNVTVEQIYSGIRGVPIQVSDISYVDPEKGVRYQGYTVDECINLLPNPENSRFPYIGGLYYLLMTGELSTVARAVEIEEDWRARSEVPEVVFNVPGRGRCDGDVFRGAFIDVVRIKVCGAVCRRNG